jgi:hypothetical protein
MRRKRASSRSARSSLSVLMTAFVQADHRARRATLAWALRRWGRAAKELTLTLIWTGTSLHRALLWYWKRQVSSYSGCGSGVVGERWLMRGCSAALPGLACLLPTLADPGATGPAGVPSRAAGGLAAATVHTGKGMTAAVSGVIGFS